MKGMHTVQYVHSVSPVTGMPGSVPGLPVDAYAPRAQTVPLILLGALLLLALSPIYSFAADRPAITDATVIATWDGGKVTLDDLEKAFADRNYVAASGVDVTGATRDVDRMARFIGVRSILLAEAARLRISERPEYRLDAKFAEEAVLSNVLASDIVKEVGKSLTDQQVMGYYNSHRREFLPVREINARRISISAKKHGDEAAKSLADEALQQITSGVSFETVAQAYSDVPSSLQSYPIRFWDKDTWFAVVDIGEGGTSGVLRTEEGFEVIQVVSFVLAPDFDVDVAVGRARSMMTSEEAGKRLSKLLEESKTKFPMQCGEEVKQDEMAAEPIIFQCGGFKLTAGDVQVLSDLRAGSIRDCVVLTGVMRNDYGDQIWPGEAARSRRYADKDEYKSNLRFELENRLQYHTRMALIRQWLKGLKFTDEQIKDYYDTKWQGYIDPMLRYDCLMVPVAVVLDASEAERDAAKASAYGRAMEIIALLNSGTSFEKAAAQDGVQTLTGQSRTVNIGDEWELIARGLGPGQVAGEPIYDGGAMCIVRVTELQDKHKTPFEMAESGVVDSLRREAENELRADFETELFRRYHFHMILVDSQDKRSDDNGK